MPVISIGNLVKTFGAIRALDGLDLHVEQGEVHGFLGPNGSGKSTTIRILLGLLRRDSGDAQVLGADPWRDAVRLHRRLAYVPGDVSLWPNLTGGEAIDLLGQLRGGLDRRRRDELLHRFDLDPTRRCRTYSKGNRQKVAIVAAFSSPVELYVLDEPTSGLDPLMEAVFQDEVRRVKQAGATVLLSSHVLAEVEALCDRVSIIREGRTVESGTLTELRHLTRTAVTVETARPVSGLDVLPGVHDVHEVDGRTHLEVEPAHLDELLGQLIRFGVRALTSTPPTLEQLFLRHYGDDPAAAATGAPAAAAATGASTAAAASGAPTVSSSDADVQADAPQGGAR
ncbi:Polar-amino-acid-transporting ATPase [Micromonospora noduli]|uniref:Polar-amino-acid-transporting ATPase n=1 Tax=Micromonospora noduli TaxID=709876 RepID=A0ABX9D9T2_9ACTN|nr:ABC transporter ATP-binding protein [Micromonospora noduli]RAO24363.1 Polar-amino-acid-transporting ATPase [Micromonospora noduli]